MFVLALIAAVVVVTNMLVQNAKMNLPDAKFLEFYKQTIDDKTGQVTLIPFEEVKNTFIMLHDYDMTALEFSKVFSVVNESKIFTHPTKMVYIQAPYRQMTYQKTNSSSWYDILQDPSKVSTRNPEFTFKYTDIVDQCKIINDVIINEINKYDDKDPSRIFLQGLGQGGNMANACFFSYKGSKPLGGILPYDSMIPYSYANIDKQTPNFAVLGETPMLATNSGKSTTLPFKTA